MRHVVRQPLRPPARRCAPRASALGALATASALLLAALPARATAQETGTVGGVVREASSSNPVPGAQVVVQGTTLGTITDANGRFRLPNVPGPEATLQVRRISYRAATQRVRVGDTDVRVLLTPSAVELNAVVVTGTAGATERRAVGNAVSTVRVEEQLELSGTSDVGSILNGRAAGVIVTPGTGRAGSGPSVNIRGRSTLSLSQQPLIYIDGVRVVNDVGTGPNTQGGSAVSRLNDISPEDIESMEIIKGPAAATIYGTEAANGVIQIITKKGGAGKPRLDVLVRQGTVWFQDAENRIPTNYAKDSAGRILTWNGAQQEADAGNPIWSNGQVQTYGLNLSGGTPALRYYLSSSYDADRGIEPTNKLRRYTGHANVTVAPGQTFDVTTSLNVVTGRTYLGNDYGASAFFSTLYGSPLGVGTPTRGFFGQPPEVLFAVEENTQDIARFTGSVTLNHRPLSWLSQRLIVGLDQTEEENRALSRFVENPAYQQFFSPVGARGDIFADDRSITYTTGDYNATAQLPVTSTLNSSTSVGAQYYRRRTDSVSVIGREFPAPGLSTAAAAARREGSQDYITNTTLGAFVQQQFAWRNRLFLTGAVRVDNNSAFGEEFDLATYPKVSASWVVSEEPFWRLGAVNALKLRGAYGASGQQPQSFAALRTYRPTTGPGDQPIVTPQFVGNPNLKPERGEEVELGFEAGLFDRLGVDFTYFSKRTKDAILLRDVPPSGGFIGQQFVNIGEVSNRGLELQVTAQALRRPTANWDIQLNFGTTRDRIEDLGGIPFISLPIATQRHVEGYPIAGFWMKQIVSAELNPTTGRAVNLQCERGQNDRSPVPCAQADRVFLGTSTPKLTGAVSSTLTLFRGLRLYGMVDFKRGHKLLDTDALIRCSIFRLCEANVRPEIFDPVELAGLQSGGDFATGTVFVRDASFAKLRELSASYTLPETWARRAGASRAAFTVTGRNLYTWTKYPGLDPESRSQVSTQIAFDQAVTPSLAQFITQLSLSF